MKNNNYQLEKGSMTYYNNSKIETATTYIAYTHKIMTGSKIIIKQETEKSQRRQCS